MERCDTLIYTKITQTFSTHTNTQRRHGFINVRQMFVNDETLKASDGARTHINVKNVYIICELISHYFQRAE